MLTDKAFHEGFHDFIIVYALTFVLKTFNTFLVFNFYFSFNFTKTAFLWIYPLDQDILKNKN
jgi:hypothetical protein